MTELREGKYPYFGVPPARQPRPALTEPALTGKRVILSTPEGFVYDMRAASEVLTDGTGSATIMIATEIDWFGPGDAATERWPAHLVWVE